MSPAMCSWTRSASPMGRTVRSNAAAATADNPWLRRRRATPGAGRPADSPPGAGRAADSPPRPGSGPGSPASRPAVRSQPWFPRPQRDAHPPAAPPRAPPRRRRSGRSSDPPPRESCRTRAVAVVGTSTASSLRASSPEDRSRPRPSAFSIAQRRSGRLPAQVSRGRYSRKVPSIRIEATSRLDSGSTAVAVDVDLCGSRPMSIIVMGSLHFPWTGRGGSADDTPTSRALAGAFVVTPVLSQTANGHREGSTHPTSAFLAGSSQLPGLGRTPGWSTRSRR